MSERIDVYCHTCGAKQSEAIRCFRCLEYDTSCIGCMNKNLEIAGLKEKIALLKKQIATLKKKGRK